MTSDDHVSDSPPALGTEQRVENFNSEVSVPDPTKLPGDLAVVFDYWNDLRGDRLAPFWREFDMMALPARSIPWCAVVDVVPTPVDFIYRFWGTGRAQLHGRDYTGLSVATIEPAAVAEKVMAEYRHVFESNGPIHAVTIEIGEEPDAAYRYDSLRLPLSSESADIGHVFAINEYGNSRNAYHRLFGTDPPL